jgi:hypothetical protein
MKLIVSRKSFLDNLLIPVSKLADNIAIKTEKNGTLKSLVTTQDGSVVFLAQLSSKTTDSISCIIPECKTFIRLFSGIEQDEVCLNIDTNSISFKTDQLSFKYHLLDESYIVNKKSISEDKIKQLAFDTNFSLTKKTFSEIIKYQSILPDSTKIYFVTNAEGHVLAKIGDDTRDNTNELTIKASDSFQGKSISCSLPFDIQNFLMLSLSEEVVDVSININYKICKFQTEFTTYILSGLVK